MQAVKRKAKKNSTKISRMTGKELELKRKLKELRYQNNVLIHQVENKMFNEFISQHKDGSLYNKIPDPDLIWRYCEKCKSFTTVEDSAINPRPLLTESEIKRKVVEIKVKAECGHTQRWFVDQITDFVWPDEVNIITAPEKQNNVSSITQPAIKPRRRFLDRFFSQTA